MELAKRTAFGLTVIAASLGLGIIGDLVLSNETWGLSFPIFTAALVGLSFTLSKRSERKLVPSASALLSAASLFSLLFLWRDAPELKLINGVAVFALIGLAALQTTGKRLSTAPITEFAVMALLLWVVFLADFCTLLFNDIKWAETFKQKGLGGLSAVARGFLIALPLLLLFGSLLVSADAGFQRFMSSMANFDGEAFITHGFIIIACSVLTGGLLRHLFLWHEKQARPELPFVLAPQYQPAYPSEPLRLGAIELGIVLGSLNLLFATFVAVQLPYLFGGQGHVMSTPNLGWGEYAHRGFFELVAVVGLAIPVLLGSHALMKNGQAIWRTMAVIMVALLFVVMQSAVDRMRLYVFFYQLSTQRVYVLAALGWMALALLWLLGSTVRGRPERFAFGAFAALLGMVLVVNFLNPDSLVVRYNFANTRPGKVVDGAYLASLSTDAAPELVRQWDSLDPTIKRAIETRAETQTQGSWRTWTLSRHWAIHALAHTSERIARR